MKAVLQDWPVARRVVLGLSLLGACLIAASAAGWLSLNAVSAAFDDYAKAAEEVEAADLLRVRTTEFVGSAKEYAARNTEARYIAAMEVYERAEAARQAAHDVAPDAGFRAAVQQAGDRLTGLRDGFEAMASARVERNRIVSEELRGPGTRARSALSDLRGFSPPERSEALGDVAIRLLLARDYMNRYLDDFSADDIARSAEEIAAARASFAASGASDAAVTADLARFEAGLNALQAALGLEQTRVTAFFDERLPSMQAAVDAMIDYAHEQEEAARGRLEAAKTAAFTAIAITLVVAAIIGVAVAFALTGSVVAPVRALTDSMTRLAQGDLAIAVPGEARGDELGDMARALAVLKANSEERVRLEEERVKRAQAQRHHQDAVDQQVAMFGKSIEGVMARFNASSTDMGALSGDMERAADDTYAKAGSVAEAMARAEAAIHTIASAAQEMTGSVAEIGEQAGRTAQMSKAVRDSAEGARADVERLTEAVSGISRVVDLINEIAEQTNLLALNATIEAARAGEAGKGFAVVASEVKTLAEQTGKATEEIARSITGAGELSAAARAAMEQIHAAIADLDEVAETVASAAEEQRAATEEIARSASSLSDEATTITRDVDSVNEAGRSARDASGKVNAVSVSLGEEAQVLSEEVRSFLEGIGDSAVRETIVPQDVSLRASVRLGTGAETAVTVVRLSPAFVEIDRKINAEPGERVTVLLPDLEPLTARISDTSDRRTRLQLPMERARLDAMERYMLRTLGFRKGEAGEAA
jgi:methyl-accepting chemotaxis protein